MPSKKATGSSTSKGAAKPASRESKPPAKPGAKPSSAKAAPVKPAAMKSAPGKESKEKVTTTKPASRPAAKPTKSVAKAVESKPAAKADAKPAAKASESKPTSKAPEVKPAAKPEEMKPPMKVPGKGPKGITIKRPMKAVPPKPPKPVLKSEVKSEPRPAPTGVAARYGVMTPDAMAASRAAAAKLAAAAGLQPVKSTGNGDAPARNYTRLTKSPFSKKELEEFRDMLLTKRRQIEGDVNAMESEALGGSSGSLSHMPQHMADQGTDTFDQSLALDLAASQRGLLREIDAALARIEAGTFGICEEMGKPISVERLRHTPWARFCIEAARQHERAAYFR